MASDVTTWTVRKMPRESAEKLVTLGKARGWTIAQTLVQLQIAIESLQIVAEEEPDSSASNVLAGAGLLFVKR